MNLTFFKKLMLIAVLCCLTTWGSETDMVEEMRAFIDDVDRHNMLIAKKWAEALSAVKSYSPDESTGDLEKATDVLIQRLTDLARKDHGNEVKFCQTEEGIKLLGDHRLQYLCRTVEVRRVWEELVERGSATPEDMDALLKYKLVNCRISELKALHEDTARRVQELVKRVRVPSLQLGVTLAQVKDEESALFWKDRIISLYRTIEFLRMLIDEYYRDDPEEGTRIYNESEMMWNKIIISNLVDEERRIKAAGYFGNRILSKFMVIDIPGNEPGLRYYEQNTDHPERK